MRRMAMMIAMLTMCGWAAGAAAEEKNLEALPKDVWNLAFVWTEPIKRAIEESRGFDPVSSVCWGLLDGSVKSVERTVALFLPSPKEDERPGAKSSEDKLLLRYSF